MEHADLVDLTTVDENGCNPLHALSSASPEESAIVKDMLVHILNRVVNPQLLTMVQWDQKDAAGRDILSAAAAHGRLNLFYSELVAAQISFFTHRPNFDLELTVQAVEEDVGQLSAEQQKAFACRKVPLQSALLLSLLEKAEWNPQTTAEAMEELRTCVRGGPDVMVGRLFGEPTLRFFLQHGLAEVVEVLLETPVAINWCQDDVLHYVVMPFYTQKMQKKKTAGEVMHLLRLVLDRVAAHPTDVLRWEFKRDQRVVSFVSSAASNGHLFPVVEVLFHERRVPYFVNYRSAISIAGSVVDADDINRLQSSDRDRFHFK